MPSANTLLEPAAAGSPQEVVSPILTTFAPLMQNVDTDNENNARIPSVVISESRHRKYSYSPNASKNWEK